MKNWRTEKAIYEIHEIKRGQHEIYKLMMTGNEVSEWTKMKNSVYGGSRVDGGDPSYCCWAVIAY